MNNNMKIKVGKQSDGWWNNTSQTNQIDHIQYVHYDIPY